MPVIGSGKFITSAIVSDDGQPIASDGQPIASDDGQPIDCATSTSNSQEDSHATPADNGDIDKKMLQWKLSLHQIGSYFCYFLLSMYIQFMLALESSGTSSSISTCL